MCYNRSIHGSSPIAQSFPQYALLHQVLTPKWLLLDRKYNGFQDLQALKPPLPFVAIPITGAKLVSEHCAFNPFEHCCCQFRLYVCTSCGSRATQCMVLASMTRIVLSLTRLGEDFTFKRLQVINGRKIFLKSENPAYPAIEVSSRTDFEIWG